MKLGTFFLYFLATSPSLFSQYEVFISDRGNSGVKRYDIDGSIIDEFILAGAGGLLYTEDILFHPDGTILVTGIGNNAVKRFDGTTGIYLGEFTSGFLLANPSKMSLGPDSLIYVTQWGGTFNVVRFDLMGNFVDEFTSIPVSFGLDHIWDADTNFYIAAYGNGATGIIQKFDKYGNDLGTFIPSTILQGPTSFWVDTSGDFLVEDWTTGQVLRFDDMGNYQGVFISGMTNPEGIAFLPNGDFLICDWGEDAVHRFAADGTDLGYFETGGSLVDPNSVIVRYNPSATILQKQNETILDILPIDSQSGFSVSFSCKDSYSITVYDLSGELVSIIISGSAESTDQKIIWNPNLASGVYIVSLQAATETVSKRIVINQ